MSEKSSKKENIKVDLKKRKKTTRNYRWKVQVGY